MKEHSIPINICPRCGYRMDCASTNEPDAVPKPGDISICMKCQVVLIFDDDLHMQLPTIEQMIAITTQPEAVKQIKDMKMAMARISAMRFEKRRHNDTL